jgi:DNA-nicking Smr family endonuclease
MNVTIDLHELTRKEAEFVLNIRLNALDSAPQEVLVIHGYHLGTKLRAYVRNIYDHPRIVKKIVSINPGETILQLRRK